MFSMIILWAPFKIDSILVGGTDGLLVGWPVLVLLPRLQVQPVGSVAVIRRQVAARQKGNNYPKQQIFKMLFPTYGNLETKIKKSSLSLLTFISIIFRSNFFFTDPEP